MQLPSVMLFLVSVMTALSTSQGYFQMFINLFFFIHTTHNMLHITQTSHYNRLKTGLFH